MREDAVRPAARVRGWLGLTGRRYGAVVVYAARLTVLGSLNMDISVTVPELPVPGATVLGSAAVFAPGGKGANQAVAAARLAGDAGMSVAMIGCTGDDDFGRALRTALRAEGIDDTRVRTVVGAPTGIAMITVDHAGENMITVAPGANHEVSTADVVGPSSVGTSSAGTSSAGPSSVGTSSVGTSSVGTSSVGTSSAGPSSAGPSSAGPSSAGPSSPDPAIAAPDPAGTFRDVLVISAEVPVPVISAALAGSAGRMLRVLNLAPAPSRAEAAELVAAGPDWLVVNESEAAAVLGRRVAGLDEAADAAARLVAAGALNAVVTAGAAGAAYCGPRAGTGDAAGNQAGNGDRRSADAGQSAARARPGVVTVPGFKVTAIDTVGAGDTFVGALAVALAAGVPPVGAVTAAAAAGAAAAARPGTQSGMPRPVDVGDATGHRWPVTAR
jgi:ribokinase